MEHKLDTSMHQPLRAYVRDTLPVLFTDIIGIDHKIDAISPLLSYVTQNEVVFAPDFFMMDFEHQAFIYIHELFHILHNHPLRIHALKRAKPDFNPKLYNICADAIINTAIYTATLYNPTLEASVKIPDPSEIWFFDELIATLQDTYERLHQIDENINIPRPLLLDNIEHSQYTADKLYSLIEPAIEHSRKNKTVDLPAEMVRLIADIRDPKLDIIECKRPDQSVADLTREISSNMISASNALVNPTDLSPTSKTHALPINWAAELTSTLHPFLKTTRAFSYHRPSRRYLASKQSNDIPYTPAIIKPQAPHRLLLVIDTSLSMPKTLLGTVINEVGKIAHQTKAKIDIAQFDESLTEYIEDKQPPYDDITLKGGRSTNYRRLFSLVGNTPNPPHALVYFTDLQDELPISIPDFPVIWAVPAYAYPEKEPNFGHVIKIL